MQDIQNGIKHLREHQEFPASKEELVASCNNLSDFSADDKKWFEDNLPEGNYKSAEGVMSALGWSQPHTAA